MAALDLGGGSTQITFVPKGIFCTYYPEIALYNSCFFLEKLTMEGAPQGFIHQVATLHQKIDVYSFRYTSISQQICVYLVYLYKYLANMLITNLLFIVI